MPFTEVAEGRGAEKGGVKLSLEKDLGGEGGVGLMFSFVVGFFALHKSRDPKYSRGPNSLICTSKELAIYFSCVVIVLLLFYNVSTKSIISCTILSNDFSYAYQKKKKKGLKIYC